MNRKILILFLVITFFSCKKEDPVYQINEVQATPYNANKNKLKSAFQHILIMYANLFQKALSPNELVEITRCIESIGDKQIAHEVILSNFMNREGVILPPDSLLDANPSLFIEETYKRFFVRDISEAERTYFINFFETHPNVTTEIVYMAFSLSNEYQYY